MLIEFPGGGWAEIKWQISVFSYVSTKRVCVEFPSCCGSVTAEAPSAAVLSSAGFGALPLCWSLLQAGSGVAQLHWDLFGL